MNWQCTNFPITKYLKKLGTLGEHGDKEAYEGHWEGVYYPKTLFPEVQVSKPEVVQLTAKEFGPREISIYYVLRVPFREGTLEIDIMNEEETNK